MNLKPHQTAILAALPYPKQSSVRTGSWSILETTATGGFKTGELIAYMSASSGPSPECLWRVITTERLGAYKAHLVDIPSLMALGGTRDEAIMALRDLFYEHIDFLISTRARITLPLRDRSIVYGDRPVYFMPTIEQTAKMLELGMLSPEDANVVGRITYRHRIINSTANDGSARVYHVF